MFVVNIINLPKQFKSSKLLFLIFRRDLKRTSGTKRIRVVKRVVAAVTKSTCATHRIESGEVALSIGLRGTVVCTERIKPRKAVVKEVIIQIFVLCMIRILIVR
ncbi:hypothetical protein ABFS82_03G004600 [Erythranthe guttata]